MSHQSSSSVVSPDFCYGETVDYRAAFVAVKSRRLESGRFEAVAAFFFDGRRLCQFRVFAASRSAARSRASQLVNTGGR